MAALSASWTFVGDAAMVCFGPIAKASECTLTDNYPSAPAMTGRPPALFRTVAFG